MLQEKSTETARVNAGSSGGAGSGSSRSHFVSVILDGFAFSISRVANGISLVFHGISFGFASVFYVFTNLLLSLFFLAFASGEGERSGSQGEEQYFFHLGVGFVVE